MKANELRIGNLVGLHDVVCVVNRVSDYGTVKITPFNSDSFGWKYESFNINQTPNLNPIPLTEEWLLKFGFDEELIISDHWVFPLKVYQDHFGYYLKIMFDENGVICSHTLKHVHQLQNLYFALTGEELKYTP